VHFAVVHSPAQFAERMTAIGPMRQLTALARISLAVERSVIFRPPVTVVREDL